jgi:ubiquinone/menaquinone biosynthesis C-methylase UbiE
VSTDAYAASATAWAQGATLVYAPLARALVGASPHRLAGRVVLDVGAGTGVGSDALHAAGARIVATDLSVGMLDHDRPARPPSFVADVLALALRDGAVDDSFAAFVLNHLSEPVAGLGELGRVTRPGGAVLAAVFSTESGHPARDRIDECAARFGYEPPDWYLEMKAHNIPLLGSAERMREAASQAGLVDIDVDERPVEVGVTRADQLVAYRFGMANYTPFLTSLPPEARADLVDAAVAAVGEPMEPYRPIVVSLVATVP